MQELDKLLAHDVQLTCLPSEVSRIGQHVYPDIGLCPPNLWRALPALCKLCALNAGKGVDIWSVLVTSPSC